jgi:hypothetical protein
MTIAVRPTNLPANGCAFCEEVWRPPSPRRGYGAPAFAWLAEPKLTLRRRSHERRLVAQIFPKWNPLTSWMRQIEDFQRAA